ncbi:retropepsin-like aspartic protease [Allosphingosinicella sp.]|uniref:retropepsin-like aspartic protease n=1 Tax=Allosphingosinicella sp. TaxID=2823234 RepID=UPI002F1C3F40
MTRLWRGMKALLAAATFAFALAACGEVGAAPEAADYDPTEAGTVGHALCLLGFTGVPLGELPTGHHVVEVTLNGRKGTFVLDTGANATVLHSAFAGQFALSDRAIARGPAVGVGGSRSAVQVRIESFSIGAVPIRQRRIMTTDLSGLTTLLEPLAGRPIHGIVGQDVMKEHRAIVDVDGSVVHLIEADRDPAPVAAERCRKAATPEQRPPGEGRRPSGCNAPSPRRRPGPQGVKSAAPLTRRDAGLRRHDVLGGCRPSRA